MDTSRASTTRIFDLLKWYELGDGQELHAVNKAIPYGFALCLFLVGKYPEYAAVLAQRVEAAFDPQTVVVMKQVADALVEVGDGEQRGDEQEDAPQGGWAIGGSTFHYFYGDAAICSPDIHRRFPEDGLQAKLNPHGYICAACLKDAPLADLTTDAG